MVDFSIPLGGATGPSGPSGPQGLPGGATGPIGVDGLVGLPGPTGTVGETGIQGPTGPSAPGPTGPNGPTGPEGLLGVDGDVGVTGNIGVDGDTGLDGVDGVDGVTGPVGVTGPTGVTGGIGVDGTQGATGATGPTGAVGAGLPTTIKFLARKPTVSGSQTIVPFVEVVVTFTTVLELSGITYDSVSELTIITGGLYIFTANMDWGAVSGFDLSAGTNVRVRIKKNPPSFAINSGNDHFIIPSTASAGIDHRTGVTVQDVAAPGDIYRVEVYHNSSAGNASLDRDCMFAAVMVGT